MPSTYPNQIPKNKQKILSEFSKKIKHLTPAQTVPVLIETRDALQKQNLSFSKEEIEALLSSFDERKLSAQEQMVLQIVKQQLL